MVAGGSFILLNIDKYKYIILNDGHIYSGGGIKYMKLYGKIGGEDII